MAFKFTVDYSNLRVIIDTDSVQPVSVFQNLKSLVTFTNLQSSLQYVNLSAVNVFLDADSKNLYFLPGHPNAESFSLTDLPVLTFSTTKEETVSIAEELALAFATSQSDTVGIAESFSRVVDFVRAFSETSTLVDAPAIAFSTAFDDACLNCGTELTGKHCQECGQKAHLRRTIGAFFHDLLHVFILMILLLFFQVLLLLGAF